MPAVPPPSPSLAAPLLARQPPALVVQAQALPGLSFLGFRAGMPVAHVRSLIREAGGTLECRSTTDARMRECNGVFPVRAVAPGESASVLLASVHDSAAVIVVSRYPAESELEGWVTALTEDFGIPNRQVGPGAQASWEWIRHRQKLVVAQRREDNRLASSVTLTDGPLLDGLGPPKRKGPN